MFTDFLKTQLVLKGVVSPKEFDSMKEHIQFDFIYDNHFSEMRDMEIMQNRLQIAAQAEPYLGKYFSVYQVRHDLLGYTDGEIKEIDQQISYEKNVGIIPDPNAQLLMRPRQPGMGQPELSNDFQQDPSQMDPNAGPPGDMDLSGDASMNVAMGGGGGSPGASTMPS